MQLLKALSGPRAGSWLSPRAVQTPVGGSTLFGEVSSPWHGSTPCLHLLHKTLSHRVHFTLVSFSNAVQTNFCLIAQTNKVHIGALKVMG